jgi:hypothetical protein
MAHDRRAGTWSRPSVAREYGGIQAEQIGRVDPSRTRQQYGRVAHSPKMVSDEF